MFKHKKRLSENHCCLWGHKVWEYKLILFPPHCTKHIAYEAQVEKIYSFYLSVQDMFNLFLGIKKIKIKIQEVMIQWMSSMNYWLLKPFTYRKGESSNWEHMRKILSLMLNSFSFVSYNTFSHFMWSLRWSFEG